MKCLEVLEFLRDRCHQCFKHFRFDKKQPKDDLRKDLVEMKEIASHQSVEEPPSNIREHLKKQISLVSVTSEPDQNQKDSQKHKKQQKEEVQEEEFVSIQSHHSVEADNGIGSSQKLISQLERLKKNRKSSKHFLIRNSQSYYSSELQENSTNEKVNLDDEVLRLKQWLGEEYGKSKYVSFRISHAVRLRMHGQAMTNHILHKFDDFKINFLYESSEKSGYYFLNKSKTLEAQFHHDQAGSFLQRQKIISYYRIKCFTNKLAPILQIFSSKKIMKIIHNFPLVRLVQYEGGSLGMVLPILQVCQSNKHSRQARTYHLATQLSQADSSQSGRQVLGVTYSLDDGQDSWQRIMKIMIGLTGEVQVYCQSYEQSNNDMQLYFQKKFTQLQKCLSDLKLIPSE